MNSSTLCVANGDIAFGPQVEPCLRDFDFTLQFENLILSVLPSALFLLIAPVRIWSLRGQRKRVGGSTFQLVKLFTIVTFGVLQLSLLVLWCLDASERTPASIAAATLSLVDAFTFCILSYAEHGRSIRPSMVLGSFLFFSLLFDIVRVRTLWLIGEDSNTARLFTTSVVLKAGILILEAKEKRDYLNDQDKCRGPEELSGVFSQGVFYWLNHLVTSGYRKVLSLEDLYPLDDQLTAPMLQGKLSKSWERSSGNAKHRLFLDTLRAFKWELFTPVVPRLFLVAFTFGQPILLNTFIDYLQDSNASDNIGYGLIGAYGFTYLGLAVSTGFYYHRVYRFVTMVRGALVTVIYRKTTEISITALDNSAAVTLMSADVERICQGLRSLHEFWANLIQVGIATYLLRRQLGSVACIAPVLMAIVSGVGAFSLSGGAGKRQGVWMKAIQKRVGVTSAMLSSMKGVKMAGLTEKLSEIIQSLRVKEVASAIRFRMMLIYNITIAFVPMHLSPVITFGAFVAISRASGQSLDTARMFTSVSLLTLLSQPLSQVFQTIPKFVAALGCFQRIQVFMLSDTKSDHRLRIRDRIDSEVFTLEPEYGYETIELQPTRITSGNADNHAIVVENGTFGWNSTDVLKDISFSIGKSQLTMLIGPVACGKSTILKALLGETPSSQGFVYVESKKVAFCDQTPWLKNGTVQKNILGFSLFDGPWYNSVINACGLEEDLATFPFGDQSLIGSKGITLSGGQKQRIAIARAVYSRTNVVFLDDVFSGMDATTEHLVFSRLLGPQGLLRQQKITVVIATHAVNLLPSADYIIVLGPRGDIIEQGTFNQLNKSNGYVQSFKVQHAKKSTTPDESKPGFLTLGQPTASPLIDAMDEKKRQLGDLSVYVYYFKILGKRTTAVFLFFAGGYGFLMSFPTVWLKWWTDANAIQPNQNLSMYFGVYALLQTLTVIFVGLTVWQAFTTMVVKSGIKLHWATLKTVTSAPMALFSMVDAGVLLNRFSQDIELIDDELPSALMNSTGSAFICIGQAIVIATASFYIALVYPFIAAVFYFLQKFYLRTSRQLRFMDLEAKSPLYTQFIESLSGLSTIRAFGWQKAECDLNHELLDVSQKPFYLLYMIQRWLTLVLDLITMSLALVITGLAVALRHSASPGFTGVALVNLIGFNITLQSLIIWWTTLETSIGAVSRVKTFSENTDSEDLPGENNIPPENWPTDGRVEFRNVSASYKSDQDKALHNISSTFYPGEKVGICGRSGSGKSTFILSLFRLLPLSSGSILIDNIDISTLPRELHRSRLNAIPQEPYFLAGTVRLNLDPYSHSTDPDLHTALQKVKLDTVLPNLDSEMDPESLSHGQRQLFCLARAILRKGKIVVLDEATSSVDRNTDALMQRIIREEFKDRTIIAVAHRLDTILDFDRIVVLDRGILVECDSPEALLKKERGAFKSLWENYSSGRKEDRESASASPSGSKSGSASDAEGGI